MMKSSTDRAAGAKALVKLARQSARTWQRVRGEAFVGITTVETGNTVYRFEDGVFAVRAPKPAPGNPPAWESPTSMTGVTLIGFLADEGGLWSLSPRWRQGALAVLTTSNETFTLTTPTSGCTIERPTKEVVRDEPNESGFFVIPSSKPPTVRRPAPLSMTRVQSVPVARVAGA